MQEKKPNHSQWDEWARNPVTRAFVKELHDTREEAKEKWALGFYTAETDVEARRLDLTALGGVDMLRQVIDLVEEKKIEVSHD